MIYPQYDIAISEINPLAAFASTDIDNIEWNEGTAPIPKVDIEAKLAEMRAEYDAQAYARARQYPAIGDQLDALFHAGVFPAEMAAEIQAVKDKYPK